MQQQPSNHWGNGISNPASSQLPLGSSPISNSNTSQLRPQVARKAVPVRKPVEGTHATAPRPLLASSNAPVKIVQDSVPRLSSINANPPNLSSFLASTTQLQIQAIQELPTGWSSAFDADGRVYYLNHFTKQTSWDRPVDALPPLPLGWEEHINPDGRKYYYNIHTQGSSWERPCGDERRRSSAISPGTSIRQDSMSTVGSGPASPNSSVLSNTIFPVLSGPISHTASAFQNPFPPPTSGLPSPTSSTPSDNGMIAPGIEWETPQYSTKQSRRRSQFSLSSLSSAPSSTTRKLHLHSLPSPHLPSNTPSSVRQSIDMSIKGTKIAANYGKKGVSLMAQGAKNPNTRKTIAVGIKGFKIVNGIVKAATGVSLGAEFLPDLDLLPDGILGGVGGGCDVGGGDMGVDGEDLGASDLGEGDTTDEVDASAFGASGVDSSGLDSTVVGTDVDSVSLNSVEVITGVYDDGFDAIAVETVEVDTVEVDTVQIDSISVDDAEVSTLDTNTIYMDTIQISTVEVDTVDVIGTEVDENRVDTIEESIVEVDTIDVETFQTDTVQIDTVGIEMDEYTVQDNYVEEVDVSVWYIPGTDDNDERRRRNNQQNSHQNNSSHDPAHHPPYQISLVPKVQAIPTHSKKAIKPPLVTKSLSFQEQIEMNLVDMPAPLTIRPRRKEVATLAKHEIIHPQLSTDDKKSIPPHSSEDWEMKSSISAEDPKITINVQAIEISPLIHEFPVNDSQENMPFPGPPNSSPPDNNEDGMLGFDISSFSGDPFLTRENGYFAGCLKISEDSQEKEAAHQAPPHGIEKDSVPQLAVHSSCPYFPE